MQCLFCKQDVSLVEGKKIHSGVLCNACFRDLYRAIEKEYDRHFDPKMKKYSENLSRWVRDEIKKASK